MGANVCERDALGSFPIITLIYMNKFMGTAAVRLLIEQEIECVNYQIAPQSQMCKFVYQVARTAVHFGSTRTILREVAWWEGSTPLHAAAHRGYSEYVSLLLEARSLPTIRNKQNLT